MRYYKKVFVGGKFFSDPAEPEIVMGITNSQNRKVYIDFLKIIAIYLVLFNHTRTNGFVLFTVSQGSPLFWFYLFNGIFIKIGVPVFFMASGALLMGKEESLKQVFCNRFLKFLLVLVVASIIQFLYGHFFASSQDFSVTSFFTRLYTDGLIIQYWYLYVYLAYLLMLPLLRRMARAMKEKEYLWMFFLFGFINVLSIIDYLIWKGDNGHNSNFDFFIVTSYVFYPLMGYYIDQVMNKKFFSWKTILILAAVSIVAIGLCSYMTYYHCSLIGEWKEVSCQPFFSTLIFLPTITVFLAVKKLFSEHRPKEKVCNLISKVGGLTFGIYLLENICRKVTAPVFNFLKPVIKTLPACWVWIFAACLLGAVITFLIKLIPGVKKFI